MQQMDLDGPVKNLFRKGDFPYFFLGHIENVNRWHTEFPCLLDSR
jgi:hypothetical protein